MKKKFQNHLEAIDWIAAYVDNEGQFEVLREQLNFNHIYTGYYYLKLNPEEDLAEVIVLGKWTDIRYTWTGAQFIYLGY